MRQSAEAELYYIWSAGEEDMMEEREGAGHSWLLPPAAHRKSKEE